MFLLILGLCSILCTKYGKIWSCNLAIWGSEYEDGVRHWLIGFGICKPNLRMSLAGVQFNNHLSPSYAREAAKDLNDHCHAEPAILSIEEIRLQLYSCFTCGVSWLEDHVCLDCAECGGYSLHRPCPQCDGQCSSSWKRDLTMSHACGKARWTGTCQIQNPEAAKQVSEPEENQKTSHIDKPNLRSSF